MAQGTRNYGAAVAIPKFWANEWKGALSKRWRISTKIDLL